MDLMEYQAKELFNKYGLPITNGVTVDKVEGLEVSSVGLKFPVAVKAQVQVGGRGKAGGIKFADNVDELLDVSKKILGMDIKGHIVKKILITEKLGISKEWYLSIMLDRLTKGPIIIFSIVGGVDIEDTARSTPEKLIKISIDPLIGVNDYLPRYLLSKSGSSFEYFDELFSILKKLYKMFCEYDCMLAEINPLVISDENKLVALDGKVSVDDSALNRQLDILEFRDTLAEDELVLEARKFKFLYIPCEDDGNIGVMSNGSGMIMSVLTLFPKRK